MAIQFDKQFKQGDIICSDEFHSGKCIVVRESGISSIKGTFHYKCDDLILENQGWHAIEFDTFKEYPNNWRLATDGDICNYIDRFLDVRVEQFGELEELKIENSATGVTIHEFFNTLYLDVEQAAKLRDYLNKYVIGG